MRKSIIVVVSLLLICALSSCGRTSSNSTLNTYVDRSTTLNSGTTDVITSSFKQKTYNFIDNHIMLTINHEESLKFVEYTKDDFLLDDILEIKDLTAPYKNIIENRPDYDSSRFKRVLLLIMDYHDYERILRDVEFLNENIDFIEAAEVDGFTYPS